MHGRWNTSKWPNLHYSLPSHCCETGCEDKNVERNVLLCVVCACVCVNVEKRNANRKKEIPVHLARKDQ